MFPIDVNQPTRRAVWMVHLLIGINVLVFIAPYLPDVFPEFLPRSFPTSAQLIDRFGYRVAEGSFLKILLSTFLHANWLHLAGNMYFLWLFGDNVEDALGSFGLLVLFLAGSFVGCLWDGLFEPKSLVPSIGASAGILAVMGSYILLYPHAKIEFRKILPLQSYYPIRISAYLFVLARVLYDGVMAFGAVGAYTRDSNIAYMAHIGGFAAGILLTAVCLAVGLINFEQIAAPATQDDFQVSGDEVTGAFGPDPENALHGLIAGGFFGFWWLCFRSDYRSKKLRDWDHLMASGWGWFLIPLEIVVKVLFGFGPILLLVLYAIEDRTAHRLVEFFVDLYRERH